MASSMGSTRASIRGVAARCGACGSKGSATAA
jgi:hypothetical protein